MVHVQYILTRVCCVFMSVGISRPVRRGGSGGSNEPPRSTRSSVLNSKLSRYIRHKRERMREFRTRHDATQPWTLLIDKHGNKTFARQLKRNVDVINLLLSFNFFSFTYAHLVE